jgi:hypothetical protein
MIIPRNIPITKQTNRFFIHPVISSTTRMDGVTFSKLSILALCEPIVYDLRSTVGSAVSVLHTGQYIRIPDDSR